MPHRPLLDSLSSLNIPPIHVSWFHSFLQGHTQQVVIEGSHSSKSHVISGVPQGSILGPLLFILYINELADLLLLNSAKLTLYADDILLSQEISAPSSMHYVQSNINLISNWISSHHLTINSLKTKYMIISRKSPTFLASIPPLCLNNSQLDFVTSFKYLGIIISSNLSWSLHIQSICSKARQIIGVIYHSFYQHASPQTLFTLYRSLVLLHLTYCSSVWDPPKNSFYSTLLEKLNSLPYGCVLITGLVIIIPFSLLITFLPFQFIAPSANYV